MNSFQEACQKLGLLEDDTEIENAIREACTVCLGDQLISFFGSILEFCRPGDPLGLWNMFKSELMYHAEYVLKLNAAEAENSVVRNLEIQLSRSGCTMKEFKLPEPKIIETENRIASIISSETSFDRENLLKKTCDAVKMMNDDQLDIFHDVIDSVTNEKGKLFCVNAAGGTGKTFVVTALLDAVRGDGLVALATASSGVAAQLLPNGTTIHSRFKVPFNITKSSTCNFSQSDATGKLMNMTKLIIIDEMTMQHRFIYECLDRSLRDVRKTDKLFGGITVVFSGDWRQCLPIVKHGGKAEVIDACLKSSYIWKSVSVKNLTRTLYE